MSLQRQTESALACLMASVFVMSVPACSRPAAEPRGSEAGSQEETKGPHGGRLLRDGDFGVEVTIFERGVPPEFRVYAFEAGKPVPPSAVQLSIDLHRFGGRVDKIRFAPREDYLLGDATVEEPHSFDVDVTAEYAGTHQWRYASYEGRTELSPAAIASSGIEIATVGPATIRSFVKANGRIIPNEDHLAHVIPRFPGVAKDVRRRLGDRVARSETLAVVQSNESLQSYDVTSPIAGTVIAKHVTAGEFAREGEPIYTIADLSTVWADLNVPVEDFGMLREGQTVTLQAGGGIAQSEGRIIYLSPLGAENTQMLLARVEVANPTGAWKPGLYVGGDVLVEESTVPVAVEVSGVQTFRDWDVVFLNDGTVFQAMPIELGRRDAEYVEVVGGLAGGERYAAENSFIVKADVGKSGATHDH
jgi:cobalt-zinc-cadmium efflux system membrane fusion protein